jgi:hypothetical protein
MQEFFVRRANSFESAGPPKRDAFDLIDYSNISSGYRRMKFSDLVVEEALVGP